MSPKHYLGPSELPPPSSLLIGKFPDDAGYYLLYRDSLGNGYYYRYGTGPDAPWGLIRRSLTSPDNLYWFTY